MREGRSRSRREEDEGRKEGVESWKEDEGRQEQEKEGRRGMNEGRTERNERGRGSKAKEGR